MVLCPNIRGYPLTIGVALEELGCLVEDESCGFLAPKVDCVSAIQHEGGSRVGQWDLEGFLSFFLFLLTDSRSSKSTQDCAWESGRLQHDTVDPRKAGHMAKISVTTRFK